MRMQNLLKNYIIIRFASAARDGNDYFILLIVTDGIITDMPQTTEAIVNVSCVWSNWKPLILLPNKTEKHDASM